MDIRAIRAHRSCLGQVQMERDKRVIFNSKPHYHCIPRLGLHTHQPCRNISNDTARRQTPKFTFSYRCVLRKKRWSLLILLGLYVAWELCVCMCVCVSSVILYLILSGKVSLLIPGAHQFGQASGTMNSRDLPASASPALELQTGVTTPNFVSQLQRS